MPLYNLVDEPPFFGFPTTGLQIVHGIPTFLCVDDFVDPA